MLRRGEACRNPGGNESTSLLSNFSRARGGAKLAGYLSCVVERIPLHCEGKRLDVTLAARWRRRRAASHKCSSKSSVSTVLPRALATPGDDVEIINLFLATQSAVSNAPKVQTQHAEVSWQEQSTPGKTNTLYSFGKGRDRLPSGPTVIFVRGNAITITGETAVFDDIGASGLRVLRRHCARCGSPLTTQSEATPGVFFVKGRHHRLQRVVPS